MFFPENKNEYDLDFYPENICFKLVPSTEHFMVSDHLTLSAQEICPIGTELIAINGQEVCSRLQKPKDVMEILMHAPRRVRLRFRLYRVNTLSIYFFLKPKICSKITNIRPSIKQPKKWKVPKLCT